MLFSFFQVREDELLHVVFMVFHFSELKQSLFQKTSKENRFARLAEGFLRKVLA